MYLNVSARGTWPVGGGVSLKKASGCLGKLWWRGGAGASGREAAVPQSGGERVTSTSSGHVSSHGPPLTRRFRWVQLDYLWALQYCHTLFEFRIWHCQNCASLLESVRVIVVRNYLNILTNYIYPSKYWQLPTLYEYLLHNNKTRTYRHFHHIEWKLEPKNFNGLL